MNVKTTYIGIESIMISSSKVTMDCGIIFKGENQSKTIFTSIVCSLNELLFLLNLVNDDISNGVLMKIDSITNGLKEEEPFQIEMSEYFKKSLWPLNISLTLSPVELPNGFVAFYHFTTINKANE